MTPYARAIHLTGRIRPGIISAAADMAHTADTVPDTGVLPINDDIVDLNGNHPLRLDRSVRIEPRTLKKVEAYIIDLRQFLKSAAVGALGMLAGAGWFCIHLGLSIPGGNRSAGRLYPTWKLRSMPYRRSFPCSPGNPPRGGTTGRAGESRTDWPNCRAVLFMPGKSVRILPWFED